MFNDVSDYYKCLLCQSLLISPIQTECGCRFCKSCHASSNTMDSNNKCLFCQDQIYDPSIINTDKSIEKELRAMKFELTYEEILNIKNSNRELEKVNEEINSRNVKLNELQDENLSLKVLNEHLSDQIDPTKACYLINYKHNNVLWVITDIRNKIRKAQSNDNSDQILQSPQFYLQKPGYKLSLKLHLLGIGQGVNTHLSIYFTIHPGEFDDELFWPYKNKLKIEIIKKDDHVSNCLQVDPDLSDDYPEKGQEKFIEIIKICEDDNWLQYSALIIALSFV